MLRKETLLNNSNHLPLADKKITTVSEEVEEIMGRIPHWIIRFGITIIFSILFLIITGSFIFKYPDVITSNIIITSENPAVSLVAKNSGKIDSLLVSNEEFVKQNQILAILENSANANHIIDLKEKLNEFSVFFNDPLTEIKISFPLNYSLGQVQSAFSNFLRQYKDYRSYLSVDVIGKKIKSIQQQKIDYSNYETKLKSQANNQEKSLNLTYKQFLRDSSLYINKVISTADYEKSEQTFLQMKSNFQSLLATIANTQMQINQLNFQIYDLEGQQSEKVQTYVNVVKEAYDNLKANISEWEKQYLIISSIDGKVTFTQFWTKNQNVTSGEIVLNIIPLKPRKILGRTKIPVIGSGKVKVGQKVLIKLDNFPYNEFGMIEGKISCISLIPENTKTEGYYTAEIILPNGLMTNYKKELQFNQEMQGSGEIITNSLSLFERIVAPLKSTIKKSI